MINVIINTRFAAIHSWPNCHIDEVDFLKYPHRHEFHVTAKKSVKHNDRDIEIIQLKDHINRFIYEAWDNRNIGSLSCEDLCEILAEKFQLDYVSVLEDGENGAEYIKGI